MIKYYGLDYLETEAELNTLISLQGTDVISGSGGGGSSCFAYNTLVRTAKGYTPIQEVRSGDLVISYDRYGNLEHGLVTQTYIHDKAEVNGEDIYTFTLLDTKGLTYSLPDCTGNHALYNKETNEHTEAKVFKVGDTLVNLDGDTVTITSIAITPFDSLIDSYKVYNFEVIPQHTYFVGDGTNWTRVHNGGGGKTASNRAPVEDPNTIQSSAVARTLEILSEGPIEGLVGLSGGTIGKVFHPTTYTLVPISSSPTVMTILPTSATTEEPGLMTFSDTGLTTLSGCIKSPQSVYETYDAGCYSSTTVTGSLVIRWQFSTVDKVQIVGLTSNISNFNTITGQVSEAVLAAASLAAFNSVAFGIRCNDDSTYSIYESGVHKGTSQAATTLETVFSIEYSATSVIYKRNGATIRTKSTTAGRNLYFIASQASRSAGIKNIEIGQNAIEALSSTLQGVYFNNTRVQNVDGTDNFFNVFLDIRLGLPDQTAIPGFTDIESITAIDASTVKNGSGNIGAIPTTYISGQSDDDIWEKVLGIFNVAHIARYGIPMNRPWTADADAQATYKNLSDQYLSLYMAANPGTAVPYTGTIAETNVDAVIVTLNFFEGLTKLVIPPGDLHGSTVSIAMDTRSLPNGTFKEVLVQVIEGKAVSSFEMDFKLLNPDVNKLGGWAYRVRRTSNDPMDTVKDKGAFKVIRQTQIVDQIETYPDTAIVGVTVSAESVGNSIPARGYDVKGLIIRIPSNYSPIIKTYTGLWDGTFKYAWTDNPAWCLYDLLVNERYGVKSYLNTELLVDKWAFYNAAVYCDQLIPDGTTLVDGRTASGGMETRYTFNAVIQTQQDAWQLLHAVASTMRANIAITGDTITLIQDRPTLPSKVINNSNVIQGAFSYSTDSSTTRPTVANVTFNERTNDYLPRTISEQDNAGIAKFGFIMSDTVAFGVVTETAARRLAKWTLYTAMHQADQVAFSMSLNIVDLSVGDVISIMDNDFISSDTEFFGGRIVSSIGTTIILDAPVSLTGSGWILAVNNITYDNIVEVPLLQSTGTYTSVTVSTAIVGDYTNHEYYIYKVGTLVARQFRIGNITESSRGVYTISAVFYDPAKYAAIEYGIVVDTPVYTKITTTVPAPTGLTIVEGHRTNGVVDKSTLTVSWDANTVIDSYTLGYRKHKENFTYVENIKDNTFDIQNAISGTYEVSLQAVNMFKMKSSRIVGSYTYKLDMSSSLLPPINIFVTDTLDTIFSSQDAPISWEYPIENDDKTDKLKDYVVEVYGEDGITIYNDYIINYNLKTPNYKGVTTQYPKSQIKSDFGATPRAFKLKIYSRDITGSTSLPVAVNFTNPAPIVLTEALITGFDKAIIVNLATCTIPSDISEFILAASVTPDFDPVPATWFYKGIASQYHDGFTITSPTYGTYYVKIALADNYSDIGLNWSSEFLLILAKDTTTGVFLTPHIPTDLVVTQTQAQQISGETFTTLRATWTPSTTPAVGTKEAVLDKVSSYTLGVADANILPLVYTYLDTSELFIQSSNILIGKTYKVKVRANLVDAHSLYTNEVTIIANGDSIAPNAPTALVATSGFSIVSLGWQNPTTNTNSTVCVDLKETEIWFNFTSNFAATTNPTVPGATKVAISSGNFYSFHKLAAGLSGYFWIRSVDTTGNYSSYYPLSNTIGILGTTAKVADTDLTSALATEITDAYTFGYAAQTTLTNDLADNILIRSELQDIRIIWDQIISEIVSLYPKALAIYNIPVLAADYISSIRNLGNFFNNGKAENTWIVWPITSTVITNINQIISNVPYYLNDSYIKFPTSSNIVNGATVVTDNTGLIVSATTATTCKALLATCTKAKITLIEGMSGVADAKAKLANEAIIKMADDANISPIEKSALLKEWNIIYNEKTVIEAQASYASVSSAAYYTALVAVATYLNGGTTWIWLVTATPPLWLKDATELAKDTLLTAPNTPESFRSVFTNYYTERSKVIKAVSDTSVLALTNMLSDKNISLPELQMMRSAWDVFATEKSSIEKQCVDNLLPAERLAYLSAFYQLGNFLNTGDPLANSNTGIPTPWCTYTSTTLNGVTTTTLVILVVPNFISDTFIKLVTNSGLHIDDNTGSTYRTVYKAFLIAKNNVSVASIAYAASSLGTMLSDGNISLLELQLIKGNWGTYVNEKANLEAQCASTYLTPIKVTYLTALYQLGNFLNTGNILTETNVSPAIATWCTKVGAIPSITGITNITTPYFLTDTYLGNVTNKGIDVNSAVGVSWRTINTSFLSARAAITALSTKNYTSIAIPSNVPSVPSSNAIVANSSTIGTVDITITWNYLQGIVKAETFTLYAIEVTSTDISQPTVDSAILIDGIKLDITPVNSSGINLQETYSYKVIGVPADKSYKVGIIASRLSNDGIKSTTIITGTGTVSSAGGWNRLGGAANITANINGISASALTLAATTAATEAAAALETANNVVAGLDNILSDKSISLDELQTIRGYWDASIAELTVLKIKTTTYNISSLYTTYIATLTVLGNFLQSGSLTATTWVLDATLVIPPVIPYFISPTYISRVTNTGIPTIGNSQDIGIDFRIATKNQTVARAAITQGIADEAAKKAIWESITSTTGKKPVDNATKNVITVQLNAPTIHATDNTLSVPANSSVGDICYATSLGRTYARQAVAWIIQASNNNSYTCLGTPLVSLGVDGDLCYSTDTGILYTKIVNVWQAGASYTLYSSGTSDPLVTTTGTKGDIYFQSASGVTFIHNGKAGVVPNDNVWVATSDKTSLNISKDTAAVSGIPANVLTATVAAIEVSINAMVSDGAISTLEKAIIRKEWDNIILERGNLTSLCLAYSITIPSTYATALGNLGSFLNTGVVGSWLSPLTNTTVPIYINDTNINVATAITAQSGIDFRAYTQNYYIQKEALDKIVNDYIYGNEPNFTVNAAPSSGISITVLNNTAINASQTGTGNVNITLSWTYTQGTYKADSFTLYCIVNATAIPTSVPTASSPVLAVVDGNTRSYTVTGIPIEGHYSVSIRPSRQTSSGIIYGLLYGPWIRAGISSTFVTAIDSYTSVAIPSVLPVLSSVSQSSASSIGTVDVTLTWTYQQPATGVSAETFTLYAVEGLNVPTVASTVLVAGIAADPTKLNKAYTYKVLGVPIDKAYQVGITASRLSGSGIKSTAIVTGWTKAAGVPNITATIAGIAAATVVSNASAAVGVAAAISSFTTEAAPNGALPVLGSMFISPVSALGLVDITIAWTYQQGTIEADSFILYIKDGAYNVAYTPYNYPGIIGSSPVSVPISYKGTATFSTYYQFIGVAVDKSYCVGVAARKSSTNGDYIAGIQHGPTWSKAAATATMGGTDIATVISGATSGNLLVTKTNIAAAADNPSVSILNNLISLSAAGVLSGGSAITHAITALPNANVAGLGVFATAEKLTTATTLSTYFAPGTMGQQTFIQGAKTTTNITLSLNIDANKQDIIVEGGFTLVGASGTGGTTSVTVGILSNATTKTPTTLIPTYTMANFPVIPTGTKGGFITKMTVTPSIAGTTAFELVFTLVDASIGVVTSAAVIELPWFSLTAHRI